MKKFRNQLKKSIIILIKKKTDKKSWYLRKNKNHSIRNNLKNANSWRKCTKVKGMKITQDKTRHDMTWWKNIKWEKVK